MEPFNIEDFVSFTPSLDEGGLKSPKPLHYEPEEDVDTFLNDI